MLRKVKGYFTSGNPRTVKLKQNVGASFIIKGVSIILGLIKVPILLSYLDSEKYGVWLTISSILMWIQNFDLGLGHGLRNKFAEALAVNDMKQATGLVSTAYISMGVIMFIAFIIMLPIFYFLDWNSILNVTVVSLSELRLTIIFVLLIFIIRFVLQLISVILKANQQPALSDIFLPISSVISLVIVLLLKFFIEDSLFWASIAIAAPPILVLFVANIILFSGRLKQVKPTFGNFNRKYLRDIYSLGIKFFIGQILSIIMFQSSFIILAKIVNPEEVTVYNIANTYFGLPLTFFTIALTPYWSAITEAYVKNEFDWIRKNMKHLRYLAVILTFALIIMLLFSNYAFHLWVGDKVIIPFKVSIALTIYNVIVMFLSPYNYFLNGVGKLNLGLRIAVFKSLAFLPVAIFFVKAYGATGLIIGLILVNSLPNLIFNTLQYRKIINRTATGVWNK
ncbi:MAG: oligosaccharide flippase family protein [Bacteroidales bacterium]|nr:oligosaccharide flippase family protein [Bacteroidales bacterium]